MTEETIAAPAANRFDRMEVAGALGDFGTLIPFVVAHIGVLKIDPFGALLAFGLAMILCGLVYRTPIPVQPMKATVVITPAWSGAEASLEAGVTRLKLQDRAELSLPARALEKDHEATGDEHSSGMTEIHFEECLGHVDPCGNAGASPDRTILDVNRIGFDIHVRLSLGE